MPGPPIPLGALYACLFSRGDGTFHWSLVLPQSPSLVHKFHATNLQGGWHFERVPDKLAQSVNACCVVKLAPALPDSTDALQACLEALPMATPAADAPHPFTCRIWFRAAVRTLHARGVLHCADVDALEAELRALAEAHWLAIEQGTPYVVCESGCCS
ncbi:hypothetical protein CERSUDRAFT_97974 [Gelatoporia subvermispora B]|uniref:Uncharacterized protein n=1 Tax=Ceriporiopsis subvermispora (strain B) TaxID=914234 RepID=M2QPF6_CERS8|nr:hypothetical protein CERSUDRAFT_97974 [Gelatoporia subvermispora B]